MTCENDHSIPRPVFVIGTARTGTRWLSRSLAVHPDVQATTETEPQFGLSTSMALDASLESELFELLIAAYRQQLASSQATIYLDKSHPNLWLAERLKAVFPHALFLGTARNPYATVASMLRHHDVLEWHRRWREFPVPNRFLGISTELADVYCRVSSDERLDSEFNSLDAQREAGEAYIASQKSQGWVLIEDRYDDGGFSGGTLERPALKRLMQDIEAGHVDAVICYKVDRLSRSLLDFSRLMEIFEQHGTAFVSVTQTINTGTSSGRLMLNILLSFAQFERELCGERIRDKIAAQRRKGKWAGGNPVLGYDVDRSGQSPKLVINAPEAKRVRKIFELYLKLSSLLPVVDELEKRQWCNKAWTTQKGKPKGGKPFDKGTLHSLLTNPIYIGKIKHKTEVYEGEHESIIDAEVFREVQNSLRRNGRDGSTRVRNKHGALLKGLLTCKACDRAMVHSFTGKGNKRYRYYRCANELKNGRKACPTRSLPAPEIEQAVVDEISLIAEDAELRKEVWQQTKAHFETERKAIDIERRELERQLKRDQQEIQRLATKGDRSPVTVVSLADLNDRVSRAESRLLDLHARMAELDRQNATRADVDAAFAEFDNVWNELSPREQAELLNLLIAKVEFDGTDDSLAVTFLPTSIRALVQRKD